MADASTFAKIRIGIASPDEIRSWSYGEVKKPETINYRTFKPERDGLFCERIFGPVKDWECHCGRYKKVKFKGIICERCGVEVTRSKVRRERMGHIELAAPVCHIWYLKGVPSPLALILDITPRPLEKVLYFASYIVTNVDRGRINGAWSDIQSAVKIETEELIEEKATVQSRLTQEFNKEVAERRRPADATDDLPAPRAEAADLKAVIEEDDEDADLEDIELDDMDLDADDFEPVVEYWDEETIARKQEYLIERIKQEEKDIQDRIDELAASLTLLQSVEKRQLITEDQYRAIERLLDVMSKHTGAGWEDAVEAGLGGAAIRKLLEEVDLEVLSRELRHDIANSQGPKRLRAIKRLEVTEAFLASKARPEWMILDAVPVISPELRPMVQLDGGRFATSDLNDLYRRIINRNNRLKKITEIRAPESIVNHEKRLLQEAVDALIDNGRRTRPVVGSNNRALKSLSDMLKGKEGRFRKNLLGKRVDYSGRSVIVVGPHLKLHQCGLPKEMALELFKPFVMKTLVERGYTGNIKTAKRMIDKMRPEVWDALEEVIREHPVLLNRAPTLHRLGIQAFEPILVDGKAIQVHPLVCHAFNADFDGDQMAVHVPLSAYAQAEARILMLSSHNLFSPANGGPIVAPVQDIVLGSYYVTMMKEQDEDGEPILPRDAVFGTAEEAMLAYDTGTLGLHDPISVRLPYRADMRDGTEREIKIVGIRSVRQAIEEAKEQLKDSVNGDGDGALDRAARAAVSRRALKDCTTVGRLIFNQILPERLKYTPDYLNKTIRKKGTSKVIADVYENHGKEMTINFLDDLKAMGFKYAMRAGVTISMTDMESPHTRGEIISEAEADVKRFNQQYSRGTMTAAERKTKVLNRWLDASAKVADGIMSEMGQYNPISIITDSGARGSTKQVTQLSGMRGLMTDPFGNLIEDLPIKSNFHEGLSVLEFFVSTHGARKGMADTALRTADAGYLTRRLVDVAQDVIVRAIDCETTNGVSIREIIDSGDALEKLSERAMGRYPTEDVVNPITGELMVPANEDIQDAVARELDNIRVAIDDIVDVVTGEIVLTKGQAISLEDTKALLQSDHPTNGVKRVSSRRDKKADSIYEITRSMEITVRSVLTCELRQGVCAKCYGRDLATGRLVDIGVATGIIAAQSIGEPGTQLTMRTFHTGGVAGKYLTQVANVKQKRQATLRELHEDIRKGHVNLSEAEGSERDTRRSIQSVLKVLEDQVSGLLRVVELFEARKPKGQAIITEFPGKIASIEMKGLRSVVIHTPADLNKDLPHYGLSTDAQSAEDILDESGAEIVRAGEPIKDPELRKIDKAGIKRVMLRKAYLVPYRGDLKVEAEQDVVAGDRLTEGPLDPQKVLELQGILGVQEYLVREVQAVYKSQGGVDINDKHIEVIVRQMLRKRKVRHAGDSRFLPGQIVDKFVFEDENMRVRNEGGQEATADWILLGITEASLATESFLSAASFQKTTRVLTEAAVRGKKDELVGLKENVIIGRLIPAGTGLPSYRSLELANAEGEPLIVEPVKREASEPLPLLDDEDSLLGRTAMRPDPLPMDGFSEVDLLETAEPESPSDDLGMGLSLGFLDAITGEINEMDKFDGGEEE